MIKTTMNFKKNLGKPTTLAASKQGGNLSLSGFSFKQLEEDEDEEDLTAYTGKYEKLMEQTQKGQKKGHERTPSSSSVSSAGGEVRSSEKPSPDEATESTPFKLPLPSPNETSSSPLRNVARAKLETSKELFSGLKDKIAEKISRTIEEFSSDSSPSPDKEKTKPLPLQRSNSLGQVVKQSVPKLHSSPPVTEQVTTATGKEGVTSDKTQDKLSLSSAASSEPSASTSETSVSSTVEISAISSPKSEELSSTPRNSKVDANFSSLENNRPLPSPIVDEEFKDVSELFEVHPKSRLGKGGDDNAEFFDPCDGEIDVDLLKCRDQHFSTSSQEFNVHQSLLTSSHMKPHSTSKCLLRRTGNKSSSSAIASGLPHTEERDSASAFGGKVTTKYEGAGEGEINLANVSLHSPMSSESAANTILQHLNLDSGVLPHQKLSAVVLVLFTYFIIPWPSYISGFIMGALLASVAWTLYMWVMEPPHLPEPLLLSNFDEPPAVPEMKVTVEGEEFLYKGWMNELTDYSAEEYHINKTHSVFVSLEGSHLRLQRPKNVIPKRAMWDEVLPKPQFIHQRHFDLPGSRVFLLPHGLVKKRIWSKKYPICIVLASKNSSEDGKLKHISSEPIVTGKKLSSYDMDFELVSEDRCDQNHLYLFARTCREKEEWFKRFAAAAADKPMGNHVLDLKRALAQSLVPEKRSSQNLQQRHKREGSTGSVNFALLDTPSELYSEKEKESLDLLTFAHYMGRLMPSGSSSSSSSSSSGSSSPYHTSANKDIIKNSAMKEPNKSPDGKEPEEGSALSLGSAILCDSQMFWVNALIGRCFFDFLRDKWWKGKVKEKLQRKLSKIHVPYFIEELQVTDINMGYEVPGIRHAGSPYIDERGLWVDLDIVYTGGFQMTIETKMNLMKLKKTHHTPAAQLGHSGDVSKSAITDSDEEDSAESSTDEEEEISYNNEDSSGGGTSRKFLRYLNKITQSKYFQQATEYKVIKRAMENVSNTPLILAVTINSLVGKLALNIPPPPSDRLWYGFHGNPQLRLSAKPQVGERAVTITHIVEWIEKKLATEFQRVFVMPNMDDLVIPILVPGETHGPSLTKSVSL